MSIKSKIKEARKKAGISQRELGRRIDKTGQYISYLENDDNSNPSYEVLRDISKALNISIEKLVGKGSKNNNYIDPHFKPYKIVDLAYDMFEEIYYHSRLWLDSQDPLNPKEFKNKDKYFITGIASEFKELIIQKIHFQNKKIKEGMFDERKSQVDSNTKYLKYDKEKMFESNIGMKTLTANVFELGNKLNDKKYLKDKIEEFEYYLKNITTPDDWEEYLKGKMESYAEELKNIEEAGESKDNYKIIEEEIKSAHKNYLEKQNSEDNHHRKATQDDIDQMMGR